MRIYSYVLNLFMSEKSRAKTPFLEPSPFSTNKDKVPFQDFKTDNANSGFNMLTKSSYSPSKFKEEHKSSTELKCSKLNPKIEFQKTKRNQRRSI